MQRFIVLHSNDIHGRVEGLARIATLVARIRTDHPEQPVLYFDLGDVEETSVRVSNLTKGAAMHRLLRAANCDAAAAGNGGVMRYGPQMLPEYAAAGGYPIIVANLVQADGTLVPGVRASAIIPVGSLRLGLIGATDPMGGIYEGFGLHTPPFGPLLRELADDVRRAGADVVLLLSHLGLPNDREVAQEVQGKIDVILGSHTHDLLPEGEWAGEVLIAQAGEYAQHLGQLDLAWDGTRLRIERIEMIPVTDAIPLSTPVMTAFEAAEAEGTRYLDTIVGTVAAPLDYSEDAECGVGNFAADVLRARMGAEVAIVGASQAFTGPLPAGPLRRETLWDVCSSSANPGVVSLTGAQLLAVMARGLDPTVAAERPRPLRGHARGLLHLSGASVRDGTLLVGGQPVAPKRTYRVAGTDWEFERYGGYADPAWELKPTYHMPTIVREAIEDYLASSGPVRVTLDRLDGPLNVSSTS